MRPLQSIAMGLLVIGLHAELGGVDALPDPLGWLLVLLGVASLPDDLERRSTLLGLAVLAGAVSVPLWWPDVADTLHATHPSLGWAANLPQLGFTALTCLVLARRAAAAGDVRSAAWLRTTFLGVVVAALLPVLAFGGGATGLEVWAYLTASMVLLVLVCLLFSCSGKPWIVAPEPPEQSNEGRPSRRRNGPRQSG